MGGGDWGPTPLIARGTVARKLRPLRPDRATPTHRRQTLTEPAAASRQTRHQVGHPHTRAFLTWLHCHQPPAARARPTPSAPQLCTKFLLAQGGHGRGRGRAAGGHSSPTLPTALCLWTTDDHLWIQILLPQGRRLARKYCAPRQRRWWVDWWRETRIGMHEWWGWTTRWRAAGRP